MSFWRSTMRRLKTDIRSSNVTSPPPLVSIPPLPPLLLLPQFFSLSLLIQTVIEKAALLELAGLLRYHCLSLPEQAGAGKPPKPKILLFFVLSFILPARLPASLRRRSSATLSPATPAIRFSSSSRGSLLWKERL